MKSTPPLFLNVFTIKGVLHIAQNRLSSISDSAALDAELLLAHCLSKSRTYLHTWPEKKLSPPQIEHYQTLIEKRQTDYPVAYLLAQKAFWTLDLIVTPDVLIPRPETELLVEVALDKIKDIKRPKVLDLGTGSGAIALSIASERPDANIIACDVSKAALEIARQNAENHNLETNVSFVESNWFSNIDEKNFDLIVSNPPYIAANDPHLLKTIRHEPINALRAENDGMKDIETIIKNSHPFLKQKSWLIIEHGYQQGPSTQKLFKKHEFIAISTLIDMNHNDRITLAYIP